jgi:para-aminobenzoate synthetase
LIRNDLNQISEPNTVDVPHLMVVESYATVHQLVSTVVSSLRPEMTAVDAVMRSFPPGSMTGAPKLRTVQIIEKLERIPRGVYSGVIGFFSVCGKSDFSVVIRTAVLNQKSILF